MSQVQSSQTTDKMPTKTNIYN